MQALHSTFFWGESLLIVSGILFIVIILSLGSLNPLRSSNLFADSGSHTTTTKMKSEIDSSVLIRKTEEPMQYKSISDLQNRDTNEEARTFDIFAEAHNDLLGKNNKINDWTTVNHDIYGTRNSNQTIINENNVAKLKVKWQLVTDFEIQDPPLIIGDKGYVQDYVGNILSFDTNEGNLLWKVHVGDGPTIGLTFDNGILYASTGNNATIISINATTGQTVWQSQPLGNPKIGFRIDSAPIVWKQYVISGSSGGDLPPGKGLVKGSISALNRTNGKIIWNLDTTTGYWVKSDKSPPNGGATAWSGGSLDPETGIVYMPLGNPSPDYNATTRQTPDLYSNHMIAVNVTSGKIVWATPFIAHGTVLKNVRLPDTHDWDTSWGSSISRVIFDNATKLKMVIGHDKMGNVIAMDAATGKPIWWKSVGKQYNTDSPPSPTGSGMIWSYGVYNYHAVDNDTLYVSAANRGLNFFTRGISGYKLAPPNTIEQGLRNGSIYAIDLRTGGIKWQYSATYPPRVSPLVTDGIVIAGYIPFSKNPNSKTIKSGLIMALDKVTGKKLWDFNVNAPITPVGPSIGNGMLFVPTGKLIQGVSKETGESKGARGSIIAFGVSQ